MAEKYDDLARSILENVGGAENVASVAHCITRVRFKLKDESRANTAKIEALKGVIQVIQANGQYQVVVGTSSRTSTTRSWRPATSRAAQAPATSPRARRP